MKRWFSCWQKTVNEEFAEIRSFCPVVSLRGNKEIVKSLTTFLTEPSAWEPITDSALYSGIGCSWQFTAKSIKRLNSGFKMWDLNHSSSPKKVNTFVMCSKTDIVVRNQKTPALKLCLDVSAFDRNLLPAQLHSSLLVDLWNNGKKWFKLTIKHCNSQTQPHFEELLLLN